jgi:anthranilate 1,2-dioxygenase small subunit
MDGARGAVSQAMRQKVEDMIHAVARTIDDDRLESLPDFFVEDGTYRVASRFNVERGLPLAQINCTNRAMLADRIVSLRKANIFEPHRYRHLISGIEVGAGPEATLTARSNYLVIRTMDDGTSGLFSSGEYRDRIVVEGDVVKLRERVVVFDGKAIDTLLVIPL